MKLNLTQWPKLVDYFLTLLIIFITDNPIFVEDRIFKLFVFVLVIIVFFYRKKKLDIQVFFVSFIVIFIILLQGWKWGVNWFTVLSYLVLMVFTSYFFIKIVGFKFLIISSNLIYYSALISLPLFLGQVISSSFTQFLYIIEKPFEAISSLPVRPSILIYSIAHNTVDQGNMSDFLRNPGMFHEPGAFAVFLVFAFAVNLIKSQRVITTRNIIIVLTIITTFSTAGYLALFATIFFYITFYKNIRYIIFSMLVIIPMSIYVYNLPFMANKIEDQISAQSSQSLNEATSGRILGARKALVVLTKYPFSGRGLISASRETDVTSVEFASYGFMVFFSQLGLVFSLFYFYYFLKGIIRSAHFYNKRNFIYLIVFSGLIINLFSQKFMGDVFFISFFFIGLLPYFYKKINYDN